jgi:ribosomal-protein-alanine N-acetyltransferase
MPAGFSHIEMVGEKVRLRPLKSGDARIAYPLLANEAVLVNLAWDGPASEKEVARTYRHWEKQIKVGEMYPLVIERAGQPGLMGCIDIRFPGHPQQADIGYWLGEPFWNQGYMTEAVRLACHFSFSYLDTVRACATVFVGNIGSRRALEKNGFSLDGTLRSHVVKRGEWRDAWFLSLLRSEWEPKRGLYRPQHEEVVSAGSQK